MSIMNFRVFIYIAIVLCAYIRCQIVSDRLGLYVIPIQLSVISNRNVRIKKYNMVGLFILYIIENVASFDVHQPIYLIIYI